MRSASRPRLAASLELEPWSFSGCWMLDVGCWNLEFFAPAVHGEEALRQPPPRSCLPRFLTSFATKVQLFPYECAHPKGLHPSTHHFRPNVLFGNESLSPSYPACSSCGVFELDQASGRSPAGRKVHCAAGTLERFGQGARPDYLWLTATDMLARDSSMKRPNLVLSPAGRHR